MINKDNQKVKVLQWHGLSSAMLLRTSSESLKELEDPER